MVYLGYCFGHFGLTKFEILRIFHRLSATGVQYDFICSGFSFNDKLG